MYTEPNYLIQILPFFQVNVEVTINAYYPFLHVSKSSQYSPALECSLAPSHLHSLTLKPQNQLK
jgi:hypothetical protein